MAAAQDNPHKPRAVPVNRQRAGRRLGVVTRIGTTRERGFGFVKDGENNEYFLHVTSCMPGALFEALQEGDPVSFEVTLTPKGQKAFDVRRATDAEKVIIAAAEETRGNVAREEEEHRGNR